jgi:hypothetical protein
MEAQLCHNQECNGSLEVELRKPRVEGSPAAVLIDLRAIRCTLVCKSVRLKMVEYMLQIDLIVLKFDGNIDVTLGIGCWTIRILSLILSIW